MKKSLRFYLTLWLVKFLKNIMKILGRNATYLPGVIAYKLCPDFIKYIDMPKTTIGITGTNGKTTTANMISDFLRSQNIDFLHNNYGSNTVEGIIATFINFSDMKGHIDKEYGILEIDERSSIKIYKYFTPDYLVITNLFRDSYKRNAHTEFISNIIENSLPDETTLILNADDLISAKIKEKNKRVYFSINLLQDEEENRNSKINDIQNCPICKYRLVPEFIRYNHIGKYHCSNCAFESPKADYLVVEGNISKKEVIIKHDDIEYKFNLANDNIINLYNLLSAVSVLNTVGFTMEDLRNYFEKNEIIKSRFDDNIINGVKLVSILSKSTNPIASTRSFDYISQQKGKIAVIFMNFDYYGNDKNSENISWLYDLDYKYLLNTDEIVQYIVCGKRYMDRKIALLLAGVPEDKITTIDGLENIENHIDYKNIDQIYILKDLDTVDIVDNLMEKIKIKLKEERV